jgi:hypothetical protein
MDKKDLKELKEKARKVLVELNKTVRKVDEWRTADIIGNSGLELIKTDDKERIKALIKLWEDLTYTIKEYLRQFGIE